jgi:hypothetical protein
MHTTGHDTDMNKRIYTDIMRPSCNEPELFVPHNVSRGVNWCDLTSRLNWGEPTDRQNGWGRILSRDGC